jgi:SP family myo-inositol transporter-like MFS transporter 13
VISGTLVSIGSSLSSRPLSTFDKSIITASTSLAALLISPLSGTLADKLGRKRVILVADVLFICGAVLQALSSTVLVMTAGRFIIGLAVGAASFVTPLYIAELAPSTWRGRLVTLNVLFITMGQVVAYLIGWGFASWGGNSGWRWMVGIGGVPAAVQSFIMLGMPESPRWLVMVGKGEEARGVLLKVLGGGPSMQRAVSNLVKEIELEVREEEEAKRGRLRGQANREETRWSLGFGDNWRELFRVPGHRRALTIACLLQGLQQLCGFVSALEQETSN